MTGAVQTLRTLPRRESEAVPLSQDLMDMKHLLLLSLLLLGTVSALRLGKSSPPLLVQLDLASSFLHPCGSHGARLTAPLLQLTQLISDTISPGP